MTSFKESVKEAIIVALDGNAVHNIGNVAVSIANVVFAFIISFTDIVHQFIDQCFEYHVII